MMFNSSSGGPRAFFHLQTSLRFLLVPLCHHPFWRASRLLDYRLRDSILPERRLLSSEWLAKSKNGCLRSSGLLHCRLPGTRFPDSRFPECGLPVQPLFVILRVGLKGDLGGNRDPLGPQWPPRALGENTFHDALTFYNTFWIPGPIPLDS